MAKLHYYAPLRGVIGHEEDEADVRTAGDALRYVRSAYGKDAYKSAKSALIVVNGVSIEQYQGMKTRVQPGDTVGFLPLCGGG